MFTNISQAEMEAFLIPQGFQKLQLENTVELVYGRRVDQGKTPLSLRVYTGIEPNGNSREVGQDAIRVSLFARLPDASIRMVGGSKRVHRVAGWRKNLQNRLDNWQENLSKVTCKCGLPMVARKGKHGEFLGCISYPICSNTAPIVP